MSTVITRPKQMGIVAALYGAAGILATVILLRPTPALSVPRTVDFPAATHHASLPITTGPVTQVPRTAAPRPPVVPAAVAPALATHRAAAGTTTEIPPTTTDTPAVTTLPTTTAAVPQTTTQRPDSTTP